MSREDFINNLRSEIVETVANHMTPFALKYKFSDLPMETNIRWRPMVLLIGNYSSGKSSLINEFLGFRIQDTGQAPTDDSFTVLTYDDSVPPEEGYRVTEERDGKALINDPEYPFTTLRKQGQRFAAHFRLKKCNAPFLKDLAIIDTPGMLDSITERDRGYDYQEVVGDLAQKAGLVLVLFDAHKAGTVREAYKSIRETLTTATFEDRIIFVLNRIDECASFSDLLRVYGTLCWNLSQITGRKDIPMIRLTYSPNASPVVIKDQEQAGYLALLENQREELKRAILNTPRRQLDHLATFVEVQGERLIHYMEALIAYRKGFQAFRIQKLCAGVLFSLLGGALVVLTLLFLGLGLAPMLMGSASSGVAALMLLIWTMTVQRKVETKYQQKILGDVDTLTSLEDQTRKDSWDAIRERVVRYIKKNDENHTLFEMKRDFARVSKSGEDASREIREALTMLANMPEGEDIEFEKPILSLNKNQEPFYFGDVYTDNFRYIY